MIQATDGIYGVVYKITNLVNGKLYFGITRCTIQKRWREHKCNSSNGRKKNFINKAISKYGYENFKIELFKTCYSSEQLYNSEIYFISKYKSNDNKFGYNNSIGGEKSTLGSKRSLEARAKISAAQKGLKRMPCKEETKIKIGNAHRGVKLSDEHKANMSKYRSGIAAKNRMPVHQFSRSGNHIASYNSYTEAAIAVGGITTAFSKLKRGRLKTYKNFLWQF